MVRLPSGTVSLVFSDVEGSTVLLGRLGAAYAEALDGQRRVLRAAWAEHGGVELGTEGDSFFVVFESAPAAVAAVVQAQRELAGFSWPGGESVRVRMGVHTGSPMVHDGGYVGMDVHRAARIAGAAHGGQVVISEATARLAEGGLPDRVGLRDLGSHQLKDIASAEHLFQLVGDGLQTDFPPLKTLGAAATLPTPATPLVGRDGELAELAAVVGTAGVRLVTLTGPGGSGKTRLAVGLAQRLVDRFPDGVYFVPLAAVSTAEVMWTTIAEVLDVPPEGRIPPGFFTHVAHRSALFILDNLEQVDGADTVVSELLIAAPQVVIVATSRRPLHVAGEHEHPVPPLELPDEAAQRNPAGSGAVQMFVQHAQMVRPGFTLTNDNTADVVEVCRRLDGLPLAIELAAARTKLLSPHALLTRLDKALELKDTGIDRPARQQTLRDTIDWSYNLLTPDQQTFFRRLGVFAGGADLDAITAITADPDRTENPDPLDLVTDLVDASLATIGEDPDGEPRIGMLETIHAYALDLLTTSGEIDAARERHAEHYADLVQSISAMLHGPRFRLSRSRFEADLDNVRGALTWTLQSESAGDDSAEDRVRMGLALAADFEEIAPSLGYLAEARSWLERALQAGLLSQQNDTVACSARLARILACQGENERARDLSAHSLSTSRSICDENTILVSLIGLAWAHSNMNNDSTARPLLEEAVEIARHGGHLFRLSSALGNLCRIEADAGNLDRAVSLLSEINLLDEKSGDEWGKAWSGDALVHLLWNQGKVVEAQAKARAIADDFLKLGDPYLTIGFAETCIAVLGHLEASQAAQLLGAVEAMRERQGRPRHVSEDSDLTDEVAKIKSRLSGELWDFHYDIGSGKSVESLIIQMTNSRGAIQRPPH